jgi:hypothetical protein
MAGTLTPTPYQTVLDGDGVSVSGAKVYTYEAGTTTNATTYTTSDLSVANANPIVADSAGRYVAYLSAGANMRFIIKTSADVTIDDQDNVLSVPGASVNLDVEGTVGEAVTAGQVLYLSSAAEATPLTAGRWYLTDADAAPTSTSPQSIGVAVSAIAINASGTIRLAGLVTTAGAVVVGTTYYVSATAGALASSAPALSRQVGVAMTTSSLLLAATTAVSSSIPNPITQDLLFTDATYDIGKSGASRPRDVFASRNAVIGGTLGVSGISTFTADLVATTASMSFQDAEGVTFGTGNDATVKYDGTDLVIAPAAVGAGDVHVSGGSVEVDDSESFTLGTGKDATIIYDGTDLTISPAAVGSGDLVIAGASAEFDDAEGVTLGTGKDATLQYDGTNVSLDTQAVGSGLLIVTGSAAISGVEIDNTATDGDPTLAFTLSGTSLFTMGVDDGDSDKFKIGTTALGTGTALTIDGSQNVGLSTASPVSLLDVRGPTGTGATPAGLLTLATNELTIVDNDQLGRIDFRAPIATAGTDAIVTAASIWSEANATFSASVNAADIVFATATSGAVAERMRILSSGNIDVDTNQNADTVVTIRNKNTGTAAQATVKFGNNNGDAIGRIGALGSGFTTAGALQQDGFYVQSQRQDLILSAVNNGDVVFWTGAAVAMTVRYGGDVAVVGALSKGSGSFLIDHPLPALADTHRLVHSFVEAPTADLIYRGTVDLVAGAATVDLDVAAGLTVGTWVLLCRDAQVFTTNETGWFHVRGTVSGSTLTITCEEGTCTDTVSWMVVAERQDQHMYDTEWTDENGRPIIEPVKPV